MNDVAAFAFAGSSTAADNGRIPAYEIDGAEVLLAGDNIRHER